MNALLRLLTTQHQALMMYDDGTTWRINQQGIVQGRAAVNPQWIARLIETGRLEQVTCQMWSGNAIWRPS